MSMILAIDNVVQVKISLE